MTTALSRRVPRFSGSTVSLVLLSALVGLAHGCWLCPPKSPEPNSPNTVQPTDVPAQPTVVATHPTDGEEDVALDCAISATFDQPMDGRSINDQTFSVRHPLGPVDGAVSYDETTFTATFTPNQTLVLSGTYTACLAMGAAAAEKNILGAEKTWRFTTRVGSWTDPCPIGQPASPDASSPCMGVNPAGNVVVIWHDGGTYPYEKLWSNRFVPGEGWASAERIQDASAPHQARKGVLVDAAGNAFVAWEGSVGDSTPQSLYYSRYEMGAGWSAPLPVPRESGAYTGDMSLGMDADGNAVIVWRQSYSSKISVWANRYEPGVGWGVPQQLSDPTRNTSRPKLIVHASGEVLAVWREFKETAKLYMCRQYQPSVGWGTAEQLFPTLSRNDVADALTLTKDTAGNVMVGWRQGLEGESPKLMTNCRRAGVGWTGAELVDDEGIRATARLRIRLWSDGSAAGIWMSRPEDTNEEQMRAAAYVPGDGWSTPELIGGDTRAYAGSLYADDFGNAMALLSREYGFTPDPMYKRIWANRYDRDNGWTGPVFIGITGMKGFSYAFDRLGNGLIVGDSVKGVSWDSGGQADRRNTVWASRYVVGEAWSEIERLDADDATESVVQAGLRIDDAGRAMVLWLQDDQLWASRLE